jgi:hypothetical protein
MLRSVIQGGIVRVNQLWLGMVVIATAPAWGAPPVVAISSSAPTQHGGYQVSNEFTMDPTQHSVISPPADVRTGDLLRIRPLRLNGDEYLVLQKCNSADCSTAQVIRAWNAAGVMGPYPILSNKVRIEAGSKYMIWMQRISTKGGDSFSFYKRDSPPLVFAPAGPARIFAAADLKRALQDGPTPVTRSAKDGHAFVATFEGGSVVRMEMLRAESAR